MGKTYLVNLTAYEIECIFSALRNKKMDLGYDTEKTLVQASAKLLKAIDNKPSQKSPKDPKLGGR